MPNSPQQASDLASAIAGRLARLRDWWQRRHEFDGVDSREIERIAHDVRMTTEELKAFVALGPQATALLEERMRALGVTRADVEAVAHGVMGDLERTCATCGAKGVCAGDLARRPDDAAWTRYCPNAGMLVSAVKARDPSA